MTQRATPAHDGVVISMRGLRKSYGDLEAVAGIDLEIGEGEVFALLGPNGAGKTTTVEILEGYRQRSAGDVSVLGFDPGLGAREMKERIGIVLQSTGVERYLTVSEVLRLYGGYYPHPRPVDQLMEMSGLADRADIRVNRLSGGQRRRLDLAIALAGDPELIFLDEPTTGFDPSARRQAWEAVRNLTSLGRTVLLTTHFMDEAQALADRLAVMVAGRIVAHGTPDQVIGADATTIVRVRLPQGAPALPADLVPQPSDEAGAVEFHTKDPTTFLHRLTSWALDAGIALEDLSVSRPSLEDRYLALTGDGADGRATESAQPASPGGAA